MDVHAHLHDGERLLHATHPTRSVLVGWIVQSVATALLVTAGLTIAAVIVGNAISVNVSPWIVAPVLFLASLYLFIRSAQKRYRKTLLRITTERILLVYPKSPFSFHQKTIKWNQFQESVTGKGGIFQIFSKAKVLKIRYGSPDAPLIATFPPIRRAQDVKHYLDKVDSAVRHNTIDETKAFVDKPKGHRDE
jgi:hypothetical protein